MLYQHYNMMMLLKICKLIVRDLLKIRGMHCWLCNHRTVLCGYNPLANCQRCGIENVTPHKEGKGSIPPIPVEILYELRTNIH